MAVLSDVPKFCPPIASSTAPVVGALNAEILVAEPDNVLTRYSRCVSNDKASVAEPPLPVKALTATVLPSDSPEAIKVASEESLVQIVLSAAEPPIRLPGL
eukprot:2855290-Rhodomonas_salina.1